MHLPTCSSPTPSTVLLYHICDVARRQTVVSSYPRVKKSILFVCRRAPVQKERPYHRSTSVYTMFAMLYVDRTSTTGDCRSAIEPIRLRQSALYRRLPFPRTGKHFFLKLSTTRTTRTFRQVRAISATLPHSQLRVIPVPEDNCWCSHLPLLA